MCSAQDNAALPDVRFTHSEIRGSMAIQRLTAAYRSRSRPSSTLGAKASTVCPYYLDGDLFEGEPKFSLGDTRYIGYCAVFKVRKEVSRHERRPGTKSSSDRRVTRRSLKTQQHAKSPRGRFRRRNH
jgi:hypothetical protein